MNEHILAALPEAKYIDNDKLVDIVWPKLDHDTILGLMTAMNLSDTDPADPGAWPNA